MQARSTSVRWHHPAVAVIAVLLTMTATTRGQLQPIDSFQEMPGGVFYNVWNPSPCGQHYWYPFTMEVGGTQVTVTPLGSTPPPGYEDGPYSVGCFGWSSPTVWKVLPDSAADPGDFIGNYETAAAPFGDLILDFSEPLTSFGFTSWVGRPCSSGHNPGDTAMLYDGLHATGNLLGSVSSSHSLTSCYHTIDFVGLVGDTPQIRSVRIPVDSPGGIYVDGIAVSVGAPCAEPSVNAQPEPVMTCGAGSSFSVTPAGAVPIMTHWRIESPADSGTYIGVTEPSFVEPATGLTFDASGAATDTLVVSHVQLGTHPDTIRFIAAVSNDCGDVTSDPVALAVLPGVAPDLDGDCDVDADDLLLFESCASGPNVLLTPGCEGKDFDSDGDTDQSDFGVFQRCHSGQDNPAYPDCAN